MKIEEKQVAEVAQLASLALSSEEMKRFAEQLSGILTYVEKLETLYIAKIEPTSHVVPLTNVSRKDTVRPSLPVEDVLRNAPDQEPPFFRVPKIIE